MGMRVQPLCGELGQNCSCEPPSTIEATTSSFGLLSASGLLDLVGSYNLAYPSTHENVLRFLEGEFLHIASLFLSDEGCLHGPLRANYTRVFSQSFLREDLT
jgi:hypothetical protein